MTELTKLYLSDKLNDFRQYAILPMLYQSMNTLLSTIITIIIPYTPFNLLIYLLIFIFIYIFNPNNSTYKMVYQCVSYQAIPEYEFSWKSTLVNTYYVYVIIAFLLNYDTIYHLKHMNI